MASLIATLCCGTFFGAALYISLVQHPAAMQAGTEFALRFFSPMYRRAAPLQASLALVGTVAAAAAFFFGSGRVWLIAAVLIFSVVPLTLLLIRPVNHVLMSGVLNPSSSEASQLLSRWARLHSLRTVASGIAFLACLIGVLPPR